MSINIQLGLKKTTFKVNVWVTQWCSTHHFGHPVGSTVSGAASEPAGFSECGKGERLQGVYSEDPETLPV